jgi:hypothetical protein
METLRKNITDICFDTVGVVGSIPIARTILNQLIRKKAVFSQQCDEAAFSFIPYQSRQFLKIHTKRCEKGVNDDP